MSNYLVIVVQTDSTITDMNNHQNQATKQFESMNACVDKIMKAVAVGSNLISVSTTATQPSITLSGTGSQTNNFQF